MTARTETQRLAGFEFSYRIVGDGPALLLFHGAEGDHQIYDKLQDALPNTVTSVSFDQRDCGRTAWDHPSPYSLQDVAHDGLRLMEALGYERFHVLGNSIGGVLAQLAALHWPEQIDRLILGLTWPGDERLADLNPEGLARRAAYAAMGEAGLHPMAELASSPAYLRNHPELLDELRALRTEPTAEAIARRQAAFAQPLAVDPGAIAHETLVIGGESDQIVPASVCRRLAERMPRARYALLPNAGHLAARQYPGALADLIKDFLNE